MTRAVAEAHLRDKRLVPPATPASPTAVPRLESRPHVRLEQPADARSGRPQRMPSGAGEPAPTRGTPCSLKSLGFFFFSNSLIEELLHVNRAVLTQEGIHLECSKMWHIQIFFCNFLFSFVLIHWRGGETAEKTRCHPLVPSSSACNSQGWAGNATEGPTQAQGTQSLEPPPLLPTV